MIKSRVRLLSLIQRVRKLVINSSFTSIILPRRFSYLQYISLFRLITESFKSGNNQMHWHRIIHLALAWGATFGKAQFVHPPPQSDSIYTDDNPVWPNGSTQGIEWTGNGTDVALYLYQNVPQGLLGNPSVLNSTIYNSGSKSSRPRTKRALTVANTPQTKAILILIFFCSMDLATHMSIGRYQTRVSMSR